MQCFITSRPDTVVGLEPGTLKEQVELVTASSMWSGSSSNGLKGFAFEFVRDMIFALYHCNLHSGCY